MVLPNTINLSPINPIRKNLFELDFGDIILDYYCYKITDKYLHFNVSIENGEIVPVYEINKIIKEKREFNIEIIIHDPNGEILTYIHLYDVKLLKIKDFIDFDYSVDGIIKIRVKYKYKNKKIFKNVNEIINYKRKIKLENINIINAK